ncbi:MAG: hypothetical protein WB802_06520 [Candidatus Dormiibacterota bacterium]
MTPKLTPSGVLEKGIHDLRRLSVHGRRGMAVQVEGDPDAGMTEHLADELRVDALAE